MPGSAADPQVRGASRTPRNLLARDDTTEAIEKQLSLTESTAQGAEQMQHDMSGMQRNMPGMQHEQGKASSHESAHPDASGSAEAKKTEAEMKKTSDEMKALSDEMKRKSDQMQPPPQAARRISPPPSGPQTAPAMSGNTAVGDYYTCVMHPQIHSDKPGNCPICGMKLVKKEAD